MPGFVLTSHIDPSQLHGLSKHLKFGADYSLNTHFSHSNSLLQSNAYSDYPIRFKQIDEGLSIYFEGAIYNRDEATLINLLLDLFRTSPEALHREIKELDGEFVVLIKDGNLVHLFNDSWGRLPVYISEEQGRVVITREIAAATHLLKNSKYDSMAIAHQLLFGYCLGSKTSWTAIRKLLPHTHLQLDLESGETSEHHRFKIERAAESNQERILETFLNGLKNRVDRLPNLALSLSGGLDSRFIAACLKKLNLELPHITFQSETEDFLLDVTAAQQIAKQLEVSNHKILTLGKIEEQDLELLLNAKQGLNNLEMAFLMPYFRSFKEQNQTVMTGDGGDKFFVDLRPLSSIKSMSSLVNYLLKYEAKSSLSVTAQLTGLKASEIRKSVVDHLADYPVSDFNELYAHFLMRERGINWLMEGEDRNRVYAWSTSPFYNPNLIQYCLAFPNKGKRFGNLFAELFEQLPGEMNSISNPNWQLAPMDRSGVQKLHRRQDFKRLIPDFLLPGKQTVSIDTFEYGNQLLTELNRPESMHFLQFKQLKTVKSSPALFWSAFTLLRLHHSNRD